MAVVATGLAACGGSSTTSTSSTTSIPTSAGSSTSATASDTASFSPGSGTPTLDWVPLDMKVRVVNLWHPTGASGGAVDVWPAFARDGAQKLLTVPYGAASDLFAPEVRKDAVMQGATPFNIAFYPEGKTLDADQLTIQSETSATGSVLTLVLTAPAPDGHGATVQVYADELGSMTSWPGPSVWTPPVGKASLFLDATALQYSGSDPSNGPGYVASTTAGKCINYMESADGTMHSDPSSFSLIGGSTGMTVVVDPGEQIRINKTGTESMAVDQLCATKPVIPATDTGLAAGGREYGFLWGPDPATPKLLLVPIG